MKALLLAVLCATSAHADCLPADAGGYGQGFRITYYAEGSVYSWHCPTTDSGWVGQWLAVHVDASSVDPLVQAAWPKWPADYAGRLKELLRLQSLHGYAHDADTFLRDEALRVLKDSSPKREPYDTTKHE